MEENGSTNLPDYLTRRTSIHARSEQLKRILADLSLRAEYALSMARETQLKPQQTRAKARELLVTYRDNWHSQNSSEQ
jgi:hypothetical protein